MDEHPLLVLTTVPREAFPVLDALQRLHRDVGSLKARHALPPLVPPPDDDERLLCVACVDAADVEKLGRDLLAELRDDPASASLASKVVVRVFDPDIHLVVFLALPCVRAADGPIPNQGASR